MYNVMEQYAEDQSPEDIGVQSGARSDDDRTQDRISELAGQADQDYAALGSLGDNVAQLGKAMHRAAARAAEVAEAYGRNMARVNADPSLDGPARVRVAEHEKARALAEYEKAQAKAQSTMAVITKEIEASAALSHELSPQDFANTLALLGFRLPPTLTGDARYEAAAELAAVPEFAGLLGSKSGRLAMGLPEHQAAAIEARARQTLATSGSHTQRAAAQRTQALDPARRALAASLAVARTKAMQARLLS